MQQAIPILGRHLERSERELPLTSAAHGTSRTVETIGYCTKCGGALALGWIELDQRERRICTACGEIHYENPHLLVSCYIHWRDRVVFCRRARAPARGLWALPAGFVEQGETLEEAVVREVEEETGLPLSPRSVSLLRLLSLPHINEVYVEFRAELTAMPAFSPGHETLERRAVLATRHPARRTRFRGCHAGLSRRILRVLASRRRFRSGLCNCLLRK